jgi:hypothetical protein
MTATTDIVGSVTTESPVTREMVDDIIDAAFLWSHYWCGEASVDAEPSEPCDYITQVVSRGGIIKMYDFEQDMNFFLSLDKMIKGLEMACKHFGKTIDALYEEHDSPEADCVIQFALFGELIYG